MTEDSEDSRQAQWRCWVHGGRSASLVEGCGRQHVDTRFASTLCAWVPEREQSDRKGDGRG